MSRNLFEEAAEWEALARRVEAWVAEQIRHMQEEDERRMREEQDKRRQWEGER